MATIRVDTSIIEDHLAINITSFSWSNRGYNSDPDIEWEIDSSVGDLEYEDEDYVDANEHQKLKEDHDLLNQQYDELVDEHQNALKQILLLEQQVVELTIKLKPFWKVW